MFSKILDSSPSSSLKLKSKMRKVRRGAKAQDWQVGNPFIQIWPTSKVRIPHVETLQTCANLAPHAPPTAPPPLKYTMAFVQEDTQLKVHNSHFSIWSIKLKSRVPLNCPKTTGSSSLSVCFPLKVTNSWVNPPFPGKPNCGARMLAAAPPHALPWRTVLATTKGIWRSYH